MNLWLEIDKKAFLFSKSLIYIFKIISALPSISRKISRDAPKIYAETDYFKNV